MTAVAVWSQPPTADALLNDRVARGWRPLASALADGPRVLGHGACLIDHEPRDG